MVEELDQVVDNNHQKTDSTHPTSANLSPSSYISTNNSSRAAASEQRQSILNQILEPAAQERLGRIRLVKASRAEDVENRLIMLAKSGQLREKITEEKLKGLLEAVAENEEVKKISVVRRKGAWDDDDDDLFNM